MDETRVNPLAGATPVWGKDDFYRYPPVVRIAMEDGTVQDYAHIVRQPEPNFLLAMEALDRMFEAVGGYKPPQIKKRRRP